MVITIPEGLKGIAEKHKLDFVVLFGSEATGKANQASDLDIGVMSKKTFDISKLNQDLNELFRRANVEVVDLAKAEPTLWRAVTRDGKLLYEREPNLYFRFKIYAGKIWMETKWLRDRRDQKLIAWAENYNKQHAN